jgi:voltage-gated sodium channel
MAAGDGWKSLDLSVVVLGILDLGLPLVLGDHLSSPATTLLALLRTARVLRILRLFRVCHELKILGAAYKKAFWAVLWMGALILVIDFVLAILLTSLIGQKAYLWGEKKELIESWFGSIGRSIHTLFTIMTLSGWDNIANELSQVIPGTIVMPSIVLYIMLCCFTMASLVMGVISDSFLTAQREEEKDIMQKRQKYQPAFDAILRDALETYDQNKTGHLKRDEYNKALQAHPDVFAALKLFDVHADIDDLMQLHDRLSPDSGSDGAVSIEILVEAIPMLSRPAQASGIFDMKHLLLATRRDTLQRSSEMQQREARQHSEQTKLAKKTAEEVAGTRDELALVQQEVNTARQELASLHDKVSALRQQEEQHQQEAAHALSSVHDKVDALAAQLAAQALVPEKIDALSAQLSTQAAASKNGVLATQFAAQFAAQFATQFLMANQNGVNVAATSPVSDKDNAEPDNKLVEEIVELDPDVACANAVPAPEKPQQNGEFAASAKRQPSCSSEPESTMAAERKVLGKDPEHTPTCKEDGVEAPAEALCNLGNATNASANETASAGGAPDEAAASTSGN